MNQIEKLFYDSLCKVVNSGGVWNIEDIEQEGRIVDFARIKPHTEEENLLEFKMFFEKHKFCKTGEFVQVEYYGDDTYYKLYKPDFLIHTCDISFVIEIDGFNSHSTKEQLIHDKKRDREFLKHSMPTIRFTGTEVFKNPLECAKETISILANACYQKLEIQKFAVDYYKEYKEYC